MGSEKETSSKEKHANNINYKQWERKSIRK